MAGIPLEDNFTDILGKAQRGLGLSDAELARRAGITTAQLCEIRLNPLGPQSDQGRAALPRGHVDAPERVPTTEETIIRKLAAPLNLGPDALVVSAKQTWRPADPGPIDGLACFNTPFSDMTVNAYLVWDPSTRRAAACDTGTDCDPMLQVVRDHKLNLELILLTHTHSDHVYELDRLMEATRAAAYVSERETLPGATPFKDGHVFELPWDKLPACPPAAKGDPSGAGETSKMHVLPARTGETPVPLRIEARRTSGHARGGTTFVVTGLSKPLAIVGDALFAGSMGGGMVNYAEALRTNRASIFTLPDDTIICPGHGPLTTVGEEKQHNPFFPEFQGG